MSTPVEMYFWVPSKLITIILFTKKLNIPTSYIVMKALKDVGLETRVRTLAPRFARYQFGLANQEEKECNDWRQILLSFPFVIKRVHDFKICRRIIQTSIVMTGVRVWNIAVLNYNAPVEKVNKPKWHCQIMQANSCFNKFRCQFWHDSHVYLIKIHLTMDDFVVYGLIFILLYCFLAWYVSHTYLFDTILAG